MTSITTSYREKLAAWSSRFNDHYSCRGVREDELHRLRVQCNLLPSSKTVVVQYLSL